MSGLQRSLRSVPSLLKRRNSKWWTFPRVFSFVISDRRRDFYPATKKPRKSGNIEITEPLGFFQHIKNRRYERRDKTPRTFVYVAIILTFFRGARAVFCRKLRMTRWREKEPRLPGLVRSSALNSRLHLSLEANKMVTANRVTPLGHAENPFIINSWYRIVFLLLSVFVLSERHGTELHLN